MVQPLWKIVWQLLLKVNVYLPYESAIVLLSIKYREMKTYVHAEACTWMFKAVLFIIAQTWKLSNFPLMGEWISELWYIHAKDSTKQQKEWNIDKGNNLDKTWGNNDKWGKKKCYILNDCLYTTLLK